MDYNSNQQITNTIKKEIKGIAYNKDDLESICRIIRERVRNALELEPPYLNQGVRTDEQFESDKEILKDGFEITVTIVDTDDKSLWGEIDDVFSSANFPNEVKSLYINSGSRLQTNLNYFVYNSITFFLDFSKPSLLDFSTVPGNKTPNESFYEVKGQNPTWVNGLSSELSKLLEQSPSKLNFVHKQSIFDLLLCILGLPFSFWLCKTLANTIDSVFENTYGYLSIAFYVYVFIFSLILFRVLFHYLRWAFPIVEYIHPKNKTTAHRTIFTAITVSVFSAFIYDILKGLVLVLGG